MRGLAVSLVLKIHERVPFLDSLQVVVPDVQISVVAATLIIHGLLGLASALSLWSQVVITIVAGIWCFVAITFLFQKGGLVNWGHEKALGASSFTEGVLFLVGAVYEIAGLEGDKILLFVVVGVWVILFALFHFYFERRTAKFLQILNEIHENQEAFNDITSVTEFEGIAVIVMRFSHPVTLPWQFFRHGVERWPEDSNVWFLFGKITEIFPEETQQLGWIVVEMARQTRGSLVRQAIHQIDSIVRQRETSLVRRVKRELDKIARDLQTTKHKVRYVGDFILQGNIKELEAVITSAYHAIEHNEAKFLHLIGEFPNSRFVPRAYCRFLRDIVADHGAHQQWEQNAVALQRGQRVVPHQAQTLGLRAFPFLPRGSEHAMTVQQTQEIMEICHGGDLNDVVQASEGLDEATAKRYFHCVMGVIAHLHRIGIAHRDIKLENILITADGHAKLADFGLCRLLPGDVGMQTVCGTLVYAAPEIVLAEPPGLPVDIWSARVLFYAMVACYFPWALRRLSLSLQF